MQHVSKNITKWNYINDVFTKIKFLFYENLIEEKRIEEILQNGSTSKSVMSSELLKIKWNSWYAHACNQLHRFIANGFFCKNESNFKAKIFDWRHQMHIAKFNSSTTLHWISKRPYFRMTWQFFHFVIIKTVRPGIFHKRIFKEDSRKAEVVPLSNLLIRPFPLIRPYLEANYLIRASLGWSDLLSFNLYVQNAISFLKANNIKHHCFW